MQPYRIFHTSSFLSAPLPSPVKKIDKTPKKISFISFLNKKIIGLKEYLIILILLTVELILFYFSPIPPYINSFILDNLSWITFSFCIFIFFFLLFNLIILFLVIKFASNKTKKVVFPRYIPKFIKKFLMELNRFSKIKILYEFMLNFHIRYAILFSVLLLIFLIIFVINS